MSTRNTTLAVAVLLVAAVTTGCGGAVTTASNAKASGVYTQIAGLPKDQQRAKAKELAKKEGSTLSLYTSMTADIATPVADAFEKKYGIHVNVFRGNSETVLQRAMQEAQAGKAGADAVETNFLEMTALSDNKILAAFNGSALGKVEPTGKFRYWTASRFNVFQPAWNTDLIKPGQEPHSWEDLALPKYKGKVTLEVSDSDWFENVTKYWLDHGKSQAEVDQLWKQIAANAKVAKGHTTMMQFLTAGQTPMEAMNYTYITDRAAEKGAPVTHLPKSGKSSIPAFGRPNGVGMIKNAQHPAAAWLFYDWLLTDGQKELVKLGLTPSTKVPGDKSLTGITLVPFDVKGLSKDDGSWDKKYDALLRGVASVGK
ncbi:extracellular solute-binding protein [Streptomyces spinosirectus]|uniref:ABC transporter substrate-binding protein n=1 Tax=Streptomyces TaxID=1883 RepID=UPI001C9D8086|nr:MULTISPECIES: extracellular solute-binding protein [Streptomyces]MBY8339433.1 extracellular solute-binding protein [Streptomyces plumbidurans]UIR16037.1 extracellular solute-binding protein [Streptomyces spinosirectus]